MEVKKVFYNFLNTPESDSRLKNGMGFWSTSASVLSNFC